MTDRSLLSGYDFDLDPFQLRAIDALDAGRSVLVAAPTGSGKTVVAEYAVAKALRDGGKAFYTTPIKALSNQKFGDLARRHGADRVGLLTGDNAVNGDAPVVVMTTEVLRNMIYAGSPALAGLRFVVLDEVHYLQDAYRGPVWEEVIIHAPPEVRLVCLSATVSNAEELADWISTVRGPTTTVIEERRPVELRNLYMVGDRAATEPHLLPTLVDGRPNPEADRLDAEALRRSAPPRGRRRHRLYTPRRLEVVDRLAAEGMLPAIYFIFSRAACDDAVAACVDGGLRLTSGPERARIRAIVDERTASLSDDDLAVLGWPRWVAGLESGIAAHHAGMVPPFKEAVEACFAEGLVKVVFATETLALGINMPARSVVIEKLSKFQGERHEFLTPGEYTQLTGRAGRRGIDALGYAVVLWSPFVPFDQVAGLASSRTFALTSAFRPTYNMAANLVARYPADTAHHLLNLSFAQYQADRAVVRMEARLEQRSHALDKARAASRCDRGDVEEYRRLVEALRAERRAARPSRAAIDGAVERLRPGDVIALHQRRSAGRGAVLSVSWRKGGAVRVRVVTAHRRVLNIGPGEFTEPPVPVGRIELPAPYAPNNHAYQQEVAAALQRARLGPPRRRHRGDGDGDGDGAGEPAGLAAAEEAVAAHPVAGCPDAAEHLRAAATAERLARDIQEVESRVRGRTESLARRFDRVLRLLEDWGYLDGWALTGRGRRLARIYHECDLLVAEALETGLLDGLDPASMAAMVSCFTYEHRSSTPPPPPWFPSPAVRARVATLEETAAELNADEDEAGLPLTRTPDATFAALAHAWAAGEALDEVLHDEDLSGGDFVRNVKQLVDLLRQVGDVAGDGATARSARQAAEALHRGVVAASSTITDAVDDDEVDDEHLPAAAVRHGRAGTAGSAGAAGSA